MTKSGSVAEAPLRVGYTVWPIGGPASYDREEIIYAAINLSDTRKIRTWNEFNHVLWERRLEVYGTGLGNARARI